jgi:PPM family protein phosphatase
VSAPRIAATGATDVGQVREANEDDYLVGESVVAVADGMGGHLAGEVASATALEPIKALDGRVFQDAGEALKALKQAVVQANATVSQMAENEPTYRGMGTTLTAALVEGRRLHVAHVGDSRAYLLRHGQFAQLTDDHTLVQHLIDEGQITREEASTHPQRSIITRAIGVSRDIDVDAMSIEMEAGDQFLLCSDGLTGVVDDQVIATALDAGDDAETTLRQLIDAANRAGGPDNITIVLLRYGDPAPPGDDGGGAAHAGGAAAGAPARTGTHEQSADGGRNGRPGDDAARDAAGRAADGDGRGSGRVLKRTLIGVVAVTVLAAVVFFGGRFLLDQSYYVGLDGDEVVIYQGVDLDLGFATLDRIAERTDLTVDDVPSWFADQLAEGRTATDLEDARRIVDGAPRRDGSTGVDTDVEEADDTTGATDDDADGTP